MIYNSISWLIDFHCLIGLRWVTIRCRRIPCITPRFIWGARTDCHYNSVGVDLQNAAKVNSYRVLMYEPHLPPVKTGGYAHYTPTEYDLWYYGLFDKYTMIICICTESASVVFIWIIEIFTYFLSLILSHFSKTQSLINLNTIFVAL